MMTCKTRFSCISICHVFRLVCRANHTHLKQMNLFIHNIDIVIIISRDKLPVLDDFRFRHTLFYYLKVDWKEIKLVMVDFLNKKLINV